MELVQRVILAVVRGRCHRRRRHHHHYHEPVIKLSTAPQYLAGKRITQIYLTQRKRSVWL